jgi:hypothetical protein
MRVIRHEVIVRVKPHIARERIQQVLSEVAGLLYEIRGVEHVRFGVNKAEAYRHAMLVVEITDEAALHRFQRHPMHVRSVHLLSRMADATTVGSYITSPERK